MLRLIWRGATFLGVILLYRWMLRLGTPRNDWWHIVESWQRGRTLVVRGESMARMWLFSQLGLTQAAWRQLRSRYRSGAFGEAGT